MQLYTVEELGLLGVDDRSDVNTVKFLNAKASGVSDLLKRPSKCLAWEKEFEAANIVDEDLGLEELEGAIIFMHLVHYHG